MSKKIIYTHDIAAGIVDKFEDVSVENNISVPSPDDDTVQMRINSAYMV